MSNTSATTQSKLLLSARDAARALSICQKTLWSNTYPRGSIPSVKIGARVLYDPDDLRRWINAQKNRGAE